MRSGALLRVTFVAAAILVAVGIRPLSALHPVGGRLVPNLVFGSLFALAGLLADRVARELDARAAAGALLGGTVSALLAAALLRTLPPRMVPVGFALGPLVTLVAVFVGAGVGARAVERRSVAAGRATRAGSAGDSPRPWVLDTSAIIDARIADIARTGFVHGPLVVPRFVLRELQAIADSEEPARRARGRRGLAALESLKAAGRVEVSFTDEEIPAGTAVDDALIALVAGSAGRLITTDFNLAKVAALKGAQVSNVNELASALRPALLPGDPVSVRIVKEGKEPGQGVGYLEDGTMVVVEQGRDWIGRVADVVVTGSLQTAAGKMFFARHASSGAEDPAL